MLKLHYRTIVFALAVCFSLCALSGCAAQSQSSRNNQKHEARIAASARNMDASGVMTSADYQHIQQLAEKARKNKTLDDADVDWTIANMGMKSSVADVRHVQFMALFLMMKTYTPTQQQKIRMAVTPLLSSTSSLDQKYAHAVIKKLG